MRLRELKKRESRARVLEAARGLFEEVGYDATTVRMIAKRAGVSLGGVFTTFENKAGILVEIIGARRSALIDEVENRKVQLGETTLEQIQAVCRLVRQGVCADARLSMAYFGAGFSWSEETEKVNVAFHQRMVKLMTGLLTEGMDKGEVRRDLDILLFLRTVQAIMVMTMRHAYFGKWADAETDGVVRGQIEMLFDGARPRVAASA